MLRGESEDRDGDEDQNDGLVRRMFFFPPLLSVSSHSALVFFFCNGFSFVFRFFYFFSPLFSPPFLHPSVSYPPFFSAVFLPVFCFFFSLFFLANRWPFIGAQPTGCSPVCLFFSWQRISLVGTWIWDSILISLGVYLHMDTLETLCFG